MSNEHELALNPDINAIFQQLEELKAEVIALRTEVITPPPFRIDANELSRQLSLSTDQIGYLVREHDLPYYRVPGPSKRPRRIYDVQEVQLWFKQYKEGKQVTPTRTVREIRI